MAKTLTAKQRVTKKKALLKAFEEYGTISHACEEADIGRTTVYAWIKKSPKFAKKVEDARKVVGESLEKEAITRAKDGSDILLIFLLKGIYPGKYRDTAKVEVSGPDGGPIITKIERVIINKKVEDV
ncbi:hypothetical protein LCGC14_1218870 [marine sediment metagenome]|uniref:Homeodomain phBC6A51-type domain-containing protein n=1 Tax=marine sediment metagenome TaxID=412755 RepID=A0A0F9LBY4_9ZZZZ